MSKNHLSWRLVIDHVRVHVHAVFEFSCKELLSAMATIAKDVKGALIERAVNHQLLDFYSKKCQRGLPMDSGWVLQYDRYGRFIELCLSPLCFLDRSCSLPSGGLRRRPWPMDPPASVRRIYNRLDPESSQGSVKCLITEDHDSEWDGLSSKRQSSKRSGSDKVGL